MSGAVDSLIRKAQFNPKVSHLQFDVNTFSSLFLYSVSKKKKSNLTIFFCFVKLSSLKKNCCV